MHGCRRRPRTLYNIGRSARSFAARSAKSGEVRKGAHRDLPATSKRKKSCIKARNCLQTTDISCIVAVETAGCTFCGENFRICHPMNSSRSMLLQASAQEKGKTTRPELCAQDRSEAAKAVWTKVSHCGSDSVRRQETGAETKSLFPECKSEELLSAPHSRRKG